MYYQSSFSRCFLIKTTYLNILITLRLCTLCFWRVSWCCRLRVERAWASQSCMFGLWERLESDSLESDGSWRESCGRGTMQTWVLTADYSLKYRKYIVGTELQSNQMIIQSWIKSSVIILIFCNILVDNSRKRGSHAWDCGIQTQNPVLLNYSAHGVTRKKTLWCNISLLHMTFEGLSTPPKLKSPAGNKRQNF